MLLSAIDDAYSDVIHLVRYIYNNPETGLKEFKAKTKICDLLSSYGFSIKDVDYLPTSFVATSGKGKPEIAFLAEYDALDGMGHACGHHLITGISVLGGIGVQKSLKSKGTIHIIGCPAEETIGAKATLVRMGIFKGIYAVMMIHPADRTEIIKLSLSLSRHEVIFKGISSHASANPWDGRSSLAGILSLFQAIDANRITMRGGDRIDGIIRKGGAAPNVVPEIAVAEFYIRSKTLSSHAALLKRFKEMVRGAAITYKLNYRINNIGNTYYPLKPDFTLARVFEKHAMEMGIKVDNFFTDHELGSSDIGNVSHVVRTIHPTLKITHRATPAHSEAFRVAGDKPFAYKMVKSGAKLLAMTAMNMYKDNSLHYKKKWL